MSDIWHPIWIMIRITAQTPNNFISNVIKFWSKNYFQYIFSIFEFKKIYKKLADFDKYMVGIR